MFAKLNNTQQQPCLIHEFWFVRSGQFLVV